MIDPNAITSPVFNGPQHYTLDAAALREWLRHWAVWTFENIDNPELWQRARTLALDPPHDVDGKLLYFIVEDGSLHVKIGVTSDVRVRLKSLQTANARKLVCAATTVGGEKLEAALHLALAHRRTAGEWFRMCAEIAALIDLIPVGRLQRPESRDDNAAGGSRDEEGEAWL